ncbi:ArsI/CadI family heavy metal resistance metalloenzyme [Erythrobacter sp.]|uniref:ArsI/CadI family heavy metal resistance metalloenzyme n=1 Tax=Erythrobacter sp. TaxID=1042 RepID=UPI002EC40545|nr:ArsI/CadI family heavy metal resistance metalloenzyme [Erythrobacter sp.]
MKRMHIHVSVAALDPAIRFYSALFDCEPSVIKEDYAKWEVEDPRVNFAISVRESMATGVNHLRIQAGDAAELAELEARLARTEIASQPEEGAHCCYARSDKYWATDPSQVVWEMFHTMDAAATYGADNAPIPAPSAKQPEAETWCC